MKTFIANSVALCHVPDAHRGHNHNCQYTIIVRAKSKKRVAELMSSRPDMVDSTYRHLRVFCGIHEASDAHLSIPQKDDTIYYQPGHTRSGYIEQWLEYDPKKRP